jgi:flagellar hook-basal body complex protein FliE
MSIPAITPAGGLPPINQLLQSLRGSINVAGTQGPSGSFSQMLVDGLDSVNSKLVEADKMVKAFAVDDSIPVHEVTFALAQAKLSLELMLQVKARILEGYQQLMNMQL